MCTPKSHLRYLTVHPSILDLGLNKNVKKTHYSADKVTAKPHSWVWNSLYSTLLIVG